MNGRQTVRLGRLWLPGAAFSLLLPANVSPVQEAAAAVAERLEGYKLQARKAQEALADKEEALDKVSGAEYTPLHKAHTRLYVVPTFPDGSQPRTHAPVHAVIWTWQGDCSIDSCNAEGSVLRAHVGRRRASAWLSSWLCWRQPLCAGTMRCPKPNSWRAPW
jgi:hypothetical protein